MASALLAHLFGHSGHLRGKLGPLVAHPFRIIDDLAMAFGQAFRDVPVEPIALIGAERRIGHFRGTHQPPHALAGRHRAHPVGKDRRVDQAGQQVFGTHAVALQLD